MANSPNNGLINETNEQYYVGHQAKVADGSTSYTYTFDEVLTMADSLLIYLVHGIQEILILC